MVGDMLIKSFHQLVTKRVWTCCPYQPLHGTQPPIRQHLSPWDCWWTTEPAGQASPTQHCHILTLFQSASGLAAQQASPASTGRRTAEEGVWLHWQEMQRSGNELSCPAREVASHHLLSLCLSLNCGKTRGQDLRGQGEEKRPPLIPKPHFTPPVTHGNMASASVFSPNVPDGCKRPHWFGGSDSWERERTSKEWQGKTSRGDWI
jgi:hypothetical protein